MYHISIFIRLVYFQIQIKFLNSSPVVEEFTLFGLLLFMDPCVSIAHIKIHLYLHILKAFFLTFQAQRYHDVTVALLVAFRCVDEDHRGAGHACNLRAACSVARVCPEHPSAVKRAEHVTIA